MYIENLTKKSDQKTLASTLERIRVSLFPDNEKWLDILQITSKEYEKIVLGKKDISIFSLYKLAEELELNINSFFSGSIDYRSLVAKQNGDESYLPEKYLNAQFSRRRTVVNALNYLEFAYGWRARIHAIRHFQINESVFYGQEEKPVNLLLVSDVFKYLRNQGFSDWEFWSLGAHSLITNSSSPLGKEFAKLKSPKDIYENMFGSLLHLYEQNCKYQIAKLDNTHCVLESRCKKDVAAALEVKALGNKEVCNVKRGIFSSGVGHLGLPFATVTETSCVHEGDSHCRFELDYSRAVHVMQESY